MAGKGKLLKDPAVPRPTVHTWVPASAAAPVSASMRRISFFFCSVCSWRCHGLLISGHAPHCRRLF